MYDRLVERFGPDQVFMDVDSIPPAADFMEYIAGQLRTIDVLVAVIGPDWATTSDADGRARIANADDLLRREISTALFLGIKVVPVLVGGASMPTSAELPGDLSRLGGLNAIELSPTRFDSDADQLVQTIEPLIYAERLRVLGRIRSRPVALLIGAGAAVAVLVVLIGVYWPQDPVPPDPVPSTTTSTTRETTTTVENGTTSTAEAAASTTTTTSTTTTVEPPQFSLGVVTQLDVVYSSDENPTNVAAGQGKVWVAGPSAVVGVNAEQGGIDVIINADGRCGESNEPPGPCVASTPGALTVFDNAVWVSSDDDKLTRIDVASNATTTVGTFRPGDSRGRAEPFGIAAGEGAVWLTDIFRPALDVVNTQTLELEEPIDIGVIGGQTLSGGTYDVAAGEGAVWVTTLTGGQIIRVDPEVRSAIDPFGVTEFSTEHLAVGHGKVWVQLRDQKEIAVIDPATLALAFVPTSTVEGETVFSVSDIAVTDDSVWVLQTIEGDRGVVTRLDPETFEATTTLSLGPSRNTLHGRLASSGNTVWVLQPSLLQVTTIQPTG